MGLDKTCDAYKVSYYFPGIIKNINEYIVKCVQLVKLEGKTTKPPH